MPRITSRYTPPSWARNTHIATIYSAKIRKVDGVIQQRQSLELPDGDFIDIDWTYALSKQRNKAAVLFHGLEGNAQRSYMLGAAKILSQNGYDVAAVNFRGCSGRKNRLYRSYHSGETEDIHTILQSLHSYKEVVGYGVSLGGNALLKYLGEHRTLPANLKAAVTVGVPIDLKASLEQLVLAENWVYRTSFLLDLRKKYRQKMNQFPELATKEAYKQIDSLQAFDDVYTAPAHGFEDALDYYEKASSKEYVSRIEVPTLIINAENDSFLKEECYPFLLAEKHEKVYLEVPKYGGHVGFIEKGDFYYNERRALEFFEEKSV